MSLQTKRKLSDFLNKIKKFNNETESNKLLLLSFFITEILKKPESTTKEIGILYDIIGLPKPKNFGGEIKSLIKSKKILRTKNGYISSKFSKEWVLKRKIKNFPNTIGKNTSEINLPFSNLHNKIKLVSKQLFIDGHYAQAIFEAYKSVVNEVKNLSGIKNIDGKPLMERVFSIKNPILKFNNLQTQSEIDEQIGMMFLFSGAALGIRNPKAHDYIIQKNPIRTLEYLNFASLLLKLLDESIKK